MKKLFFYLMATVGLLFASCNNDEGNNWISMEYAKNMTSHSAVTNRSKELKGEK